MRSILVVVLLLISCVAQAQVVILVNSATGSDTLASGDGPATAVNSTTEATTASISGTTVTFSGATDLSNVQPGHVMFLNDSTAGERNFAEIATVNDGGNSLTTVESFRNGAAGLNWAIGGVRATATGSISAKLFTNNAGNGDMEPGWTVEMQSGHTETLPATQFFVGDGTVNGAKTLRGESGAATKPVINLNGNYLRLNSAFWQFRDFVARTSGSTSSWIFLGFGFNSVIEGCVADATSPGVSLSGIEIGSASHILGCELINCGIRMNSVVGQHAIGNYIHGSPNYGISATGTLICVISKNVIYNCALGMTLDQNRADGFALLYVEGNTIDQCSGTCIEYDGDHGGMTNLFIINNSCTNNSAGYGIDLGGLSSADVLARGTQIRSNNTFNNAAGFYNDGADDYDADGVSREPAHLDPQFVNAAGGDFSIGTNLKELGFPQYLLGVTRSYVDIGGAQREEAGAGPSGPVANQAVSVGF